MTSISLKKISIIAITAFSLSSASFAGLGLRFAPISAVVGLVDASLDIPLGSSFRLTPTVIYWNLSLSDSSTSEEFTINTNGAGADFTYHFSGNYNSGLYLGAYYTSLKLEYESTALNETGELETSIAGGLLGYQWCWTSFYMNLALKAGTASESKITIKNKTTGAETGEEEDAPSTSSGLEFKLGWHF